MNVTIYKDVKDTKSGFIRPISVVLERIRTGKSVELLNKIRAEKDKNKRDALKIKLPSYCFSGTFSSRNDNSIIEHSGFICLDFDKFIKDDLILWRDKLEKDKFTYSVFLSPSGTGLKCLVKIPKEKNFHRDFFRALDNYYNTSYFDKSCINVSRLCFESSDHTIYINEDSELWELRAEEEHHNVGNTNAVLRVVSENRIIHNLETWFNNTFPLANGSRNNNIFKLAMALNDFGISKNETESVCCKYAENGFNESEILQVVRSAYSRGVSTFNTKFFEDELTSKKIERHIRAGSTVEKIKQEFAEHNPLEIENAIEQTKSKLSISEFWDYDKNGKISLKQSKYKEFLEQRGYAKLYPNGSNNFVFVKIEENLIDNTTSEIIKDEILNYLYSNADFGTKPYDLMAGTPKYFKDDYLSLINTVTVEFKKDNVDTSYLYYKNCALEITKNSVSEIDFLELDGYVWKKQIINREFKKIDYSFCVFEQFLMKIAGDKDENFKSLCSVIGFLMHSHKTSANNKAIIFNDEVISENPNGGSGKGLFCNAIGHIKKVATIDGKQFEFNKSFPYQTVGADSQVLIFDDVKKNFQFENLFSLITEGIILEKKNKDAIKLPVSESPKVVITTNYTIGGVGGSFDRRKFEVELSSYFGSHHTPLDEFGHMLFEEWSECEWLKFDNFMIGCLQHYLTNGLIKHEFHNLELRKFIKTTSIEFNEWSEDVDNLPINVRLNKIELFEKINSEYSDLRKWLSQKRFAQWLESYAKYKSIKLIDGKSNNIRWIMFQDESTIISKEEEEYVF
jgi:hypothetical protein